MSSIVYSVNIDRYDTIHQPPALKKWHKYYISDKDYVGKTEWSWVQAELAEDNKRAAAYYKINSHLMPPHDKSLYLDASCRIKKPPNKLIETFLESGKSVGIFPHPSRKCTYEEAERCQSLDKPELINKQIDAYRIEGFPANFGLVATCFILRLNTPDVQRFNELWWDEYQKGSRRDQLSVMYASWKSGVEIYKIPGHIYKNDYFRVDRHRDRTKRIYDDG